MRLAQIRRELRKRSRTLFFTDAERVLLAILEAPSYAKDPTAIINADYTKARIHGEKRVREIIEGAWA